jgi:hypothetical protein
VVAFGNSSFVCSLKSVPGTEVFISLKYCIIPYKILPKMEEVHNDALPCAFITYPLPANVFPNDSGVAALLVALKGMPPAINILILFVTQEFFVTS